MLGRGQVLDDLHLLLPVREVVDIQVNQNTRVFVVTNLRLECFREGSWGVRPDFRSMRNEVSGGQELGVTLCPCFRGGKG